MSRPAFMRQSDLNRVLKAAKAHGYMVELRAGVVRLLPAGPQSALPSDTDSEAEAEWDKALGLQ